MLLKIVNASSHDESFLFELYASTRLYEFSLLGLPESQVQNLLGIQYEAQKRSYQHRFPNAKYELILFEDVCIGRVVTNQDSNCLHLVDISLLPEYRKKGFGTQLIKTIQRNAAGKKIPVTLNVLQGNPAQHLYERCGFYIEEIVDPYISMRFENI